MYDITEVAEMLEEMDRKSGDFETWRHEVEMKILDILGYANGKGETVLQVKANDLLDLFNCQDLSEEEVNKILKVRKVWNERITLPARR